MILINDAQHLYWGTQNRCAQTQEVSQPTKKEIQNISEVALWWSGGALSMVEMTTLIYIFYACYAAASW